MRCAPILALCLALLGCADPSRPIPPTPTHRTPQGVAVVAPTWVTPELLAEALDEIDAAGPPPGYTVTIRLPKFEDASSPTGLVRGYCDRDGKEIAVGFRFWPCEDRPLLPALLHEVDHAFGRIPDEH